MTEPENLVLQILREMRAEMRDMRAEMATKSELGDLRSEVRSELADLRSEVHSLRADVASDLLVMEKRLGERITALNRAVMHYHASALGHGVLYSELEERVMRLEARMNLSAPEQH